MTDTALSRFASEYARHRAAEGRAYSSRQLFELPYLATGPLAGQWAIRARTFDAFMAQVLRPLAARLGRPLQLLDLGSGNAWLAYRAALEGHEAFALDIRQDTVDGLGAAAPFLRKAGDRMHCMVASFEEIPLPTGSVDIALFNAALHYATNLRSVLGEAMRVTRSGGRIAILDSPFYRREADGLAMVAEKTLQAKDRFGDSAGVLLSLPSIEFLTRDRLFAAMPGLGWRRHRVRYPLSYELRPLRAALRGQRRPSRFDLWVAERA